MQEAERHAQPRSPGAVEAYRLAVAYRRLRRHWPSKHRSGASVDVSVAGLRLPRCGCTTRVTVRKTATFEQSPPPLATSTTTTQVDMEQRKVGRLGVPYTSDVRSGDFLDGEKPWLGRFEFLKSRGYLLRPRYRPGWTPPWKKGQMLMDFEESITNNVRRLLGF